MNNQNIWSIFLRFFKLVVRFAVPGLIIFALIIATIIFIDRYYKVEDPLERSAYNSDCNVQVINLNGILDTSNDKYGDGTETGTTSTYVISHIIEAENNKQIKGIVLSVDSGGGSPIAGSDIADYLSKVDKPSVAWVRSSAASAAYWASLGAKRIIANQNSSIGSIGVTYSYLDTTQKDKKEGVIFRQLSIGRFKDLGNPGKPLSDEEKKMILDQGEEIYKNFIGAVAYYRNLDEKKVRGLADGSVILGQDAIRKGLIDELGGIKEVKQYIESRTGNQVNFCWK